MKFDKQKDDQMRRIRLRNDRLVSIVAMIVSCAILLGLGTTCWSYYEEDEVMVSVVEKEVVVKDGKSKYLIYTEEEVYENTDSFIKMKWNSSDVWVDIQPGKAYMFTVYGWRIPFLSSYRNIIDYYEIAELREYDNPKPINLDAKPKNLRSTQPE